MLEIFNEFKSEKSISSLFFFIELDLLAIMGLGKDEFTMPILSELGKTKKTLSEQLEHIENLISNCISGIYFNSWEERLFKDSTYQIKYLGKLIPITEIEKTDMGLKIYLNEENSEYYAYYIIPRGISDEIDIHKFSKNEIEQYLSGNLNLMQFHNALISKYLNF